MARLYAGTSGYAYPAWKPAFYPQELPAARFLEHYASRLTCVEINYTFRRTPAQKTLESWVAATPPGFVFAVKAHQRVTHTPPAQGGRARADGVLPLVARAAAGRGAAGTGAAPAAAQPAARPRPPGAVPRVAAARHAVRLRVPRGVVVHGGGLRPAPRARRRALRGRRRGARGAGRGDRELRLLPAAPAAVRRRRPWDAGAPAPRSSSSPGRTSSSSSSTKRTPAVRSRRSACSPSDRRPRRRACATLWR